MIAALRVFFLRLRDAEPSPAPLPLAWAWAGVTLLIVASLARSWETLSQMSLYVEDAVLFNYYYGHERPLAAVLSSHIGQQYLTVIADTFAWLVAWTDVRWQPLLYQWFGYVCAIAAASVLSFSGLIRHRALLLVTPLALGLTGLNHLYYYNTLIYCMYTCVLLLLVLLLYPPPASPLSFAVQAVLVLALPWAGPFSVLALPVSGYLFVLSRNRAKRWLLALAFCSSLLNFLSVSGSTVRLYHFARFWVIERFFQVINDKIVFFEFVQHVHMGFGAAVLLAVVALFFCLRKDALFLKLSLPMLLLIFASIALFFLSAKFPVYIRTNDCHRVVASFFWLVFLLFTGERLAGRFSATPLLPVACAAFLGLIVLFDNINQPKKWQAEPVPQTRAFVHAVRHYERMGLREAKQAVCLRLPAHPRAVFPPRVIVGYQGGGTAWISRDEPAGAVGKQFICR